MTNVEFTKLSSKGQIVIPQDIRIGMGLKPGTPFAVIEQKDTILLKKIQLPKIKTWGEATKPFKDAAKKSRFSQEDLDTLIIEAKQAK